ncbi:MAG: Arc family DNA-binding protein [Oscillospiraceae bacterium]|nr:Arc family DNA-binding protein [Oscillospiraceae bacterium]
MDAREKEKKQIPLRLSASLWAEISRWAEDEFRSVNGQIEYILNEAVKRRRREGAEREP